MVEMVAVEKSRGSAVAALEGGRQIRVSVVLRGGAAVQRSGNASRRAFVEAASLFVFMLSHPQQGRCS